MSSRNRIARLLPNSAKDTLRTALVPARYGERPLFSTAARALFSPHRRIRVNVVPRPWTVFTKIAATGGYRILTDPERSHDIALNGRSGHPMNSPTGVPVLNGRLVSNAKSNVAAAFEAAFGYSLAVNPTVFEGSVVEKSEGNATHDGRVLNGPIDPRDVRAGQSYQRLIDTTDGEGRLVDFRTPLYGGRPPLVYIKRRAAEDLFHNRNATVEVCSPSDVYSSDELDRLSAFADAVGLDYGEVDVLRDRVDGRIYVVDVNQGPSGPADTLDPSDRGPVIEQLTSAFDALVDRALAGSPLATGTWPSQPPLGPAQPAPLALTPGLRPSPGG